jgi:hypothetical protein
MSNYSSISSIWILLRAHADSIDVWALSPSGEPLKRCQSGYLCFTFPCCSITYACIGIDQADIPMDRTYLSFKSNSLHRNLHSTQALSQSKPLFHTSPASSYQHMCCFFNAWWMALITEVLRQERYVNESWCHSQTCISISLSIYPNHSPRRTSASLFCLAFTAMLVHVVRSLNR